MKRPEIITSINNLEDINYIQSDGYAFGYQKYTSFAPNYFSYEEIKNIKTDKKLFVILNALLHEKDIDDFKKEIDKLSKLNIGFIIQDLGALSILLDKNIAKDKIIYNPYTLICNKNDLKAYKEAYGVSIFLSPELNVDEISKILNEEDAVVEIYGYEPIYQSYRKVLSLYEEARNVSLENKNLYIREDTRDELYPIIENEYGSVIFNHQKINLTNDIDLLINAKYWYIDSSNSSLEEVNEIIKGLNI